MQRQRLNQTRQGSADGPSRNRCRTRRRGCNSAYEDVSLRIGLPSPVLQTGKGKTSDQMRCASFASEGFRHTGSTARFVIVLDFVRKILDSLAHASVGSTAEADRVFVTEWKTRACANSTDRPTIPWIRLMATGMPRTGLQLTHQTAFRCSKLHVRHMERVRANNSCLGSGGGKPDSAKVVRTCFFQRYEHAGESRRNVNA